MAQGPMTPMTISLDFDRTFTKDPDLWIAFCDLARARGHKVICVTMRNEKPHQADEVRAAIGPHVDDIVFTSYKAKIPHVGGLGVKIDVWIDDDPHTILNDIEPWP
jgi:hypothetical protein